MVETLDHVVGQAVPVSILKRALSTNRVGHAYLFSGAEGLGKETVARAMASELKRRGGPLSEIHILDGDETIRIDDIRELHRKAALVPSGFSIWIILEAKRMHVEASNAFLKILEEPPAGTYFLLTTTQVQALLPTILSRCQHLPFRRMAEKDVAKWLANKVGRSEDDERVQSIARLAHGSLGKAWAYWEGTLLEERDAVLSKLMVVPKSSYAQVLGLSQNWPEDRKKITEELQLFLEWFRDLLIVKNEIALPLYNPSYRQELSEISALYTNQDLVRIMEQIMETEKAIAGNGRIRFYLGYLLLLMKKGALT